MKALANDRFPSTLGGLVDFALSAWLARAPLYLGLAAAVVVVAGAIALLLPVHDDLTLARLAIVLEYTEIFGFAILVAAVALGVAVRAAGDKPVTQRMLLGSAVERWLPVLCAMIVVQFVLEEIAPFSGLGFHTRPPVYIFLVAPFVWFFCGIISLAGPMSALSSERAGLAILVAFTRAVGYSFRRDNLPGLCVVGFATIVPSLLGELLFDLLTRQHAPSPIFWASLPVDALTAGPVTAIQTAFALDFARRAQRDANA